MKAKPIFNLHKKLYNAYQKGGASAVIEIANKLKLPFSHCTQCESDTPTIKHVANVCGVCGTVKPVKKYFDIHIQSGIKPNEGHSVFVAIPEKDAKIMIDADIIGYAVDQGLLDADDISRVDNVRETTEKDYNKAIKA